MRDDAEMQQSDNRKMDGRNDASYTQSLSNAQSLVVVVHEGQEGTVGTAFQAYKPGTQT
jgi:hypothetical protein